MNLNGFKEIGSTQQLVLTSLCCYDKTLWPKENWRGKTYVSFYRLQSIILKRTGRNSIKNLYQRSWRNPARSIIPMFVLSQLFYAAKDHLSTIHSRLGPHESVTNQNNYPSDTPTGRCILRNASAEVFFSSES